MEDEQQGTAEGIGGVVVGDDGSDGAAKALRYALQEARRRSVPLHVVRAWTITTAPRPPESRFGYVPSEEEFARATAVQMQRRVQEVLAGDDDVVVHIHPVHGAAAEALIEASQHADVLIVGSRGRGGFASLVLGSVADTCARHSPAPVIVVR